MLTSAQYALVERYIEENPTQIALKTGDREVAEQIATLQKARIKIPAFFDARCYILPISYQQCTSQIVAINRRLPPMELAVDLTCGLGVDTFALSQSSKRVITCEIDLTKAEIARHNFARLGVNNVEVINISAEDFLEIFTEKADLIFCDPARRDTQGHKRHALQDCSPNITSLMRQMQSSAMGVVVKLSPLFDVDELFNIFGSEIEVETISHNNECKEVLLRTGAYAHAGSISVTIINGCNVEHFEFTRPINTSPSESVDKPKFLHIPDVALLKSRTVSQYMSHKHPTTHYDFSGYLFTNHPLQDFSGRSFPITHILPYKPKMLKPLMRELNINRADIYIREFPYGTSQIIKQLGIVEGGRTPLFFTCRNGVHTVCF